MNLVSKKAHLTVGGLIVFPVVVEHQKFKNMFKR